MMFDKALHLSRFNLTKVETQTGIRLTARERALNDVSPPVHVLIKAMARIRQEEEQWAGVSPPLVSSAGSLPAIPEYRPEEKDSPRSALPDEEEKASSPSIISENSEEISSNGD